MTDNTRGSLRLPRFEPAEIERETWDLVLGCIRVPVAQEEALDERF